ncbi:MAG: malonate decarboxylase holo-ACP synthase [Rudaea sp.]|nr:malonate decarboxylase holo-ACP synthase [Rudaea sp.]
MRPHDLLRLRPGAKLSGVETPAWVAETISSAPFVVVRRGEQCLGQIPVGVRGRTRAHRHAATVHASDVAEIIAPEALARSAAWRKCLRRSLPAFAALDPVAAAAMELDVVWGPGGSVGFELASGMPVVHEDSDLDVIMRPTSRHSREDLARLAQTIGGLSVRVDIVLESAHGAVALREWLLSPQRVLIKTRDGPRLGAFHW